MERAGWADLRVAVVAGVVVDKLVLAKADSSAFAARMSAGSQHPFLSSLLWTVPQLGSSQIAIDQFSMGEDRAHGIIVGDGQKVTSLNPILTEWLFHGHTIATGNCLFVTLQLKSQQTAEKTRQDKSKLSSALASGDWMAYIGAPVTTGVLLFLYIVSSISYCSSLFIFCVYLTTFISNFHLATQNQNSWAGFQKDTESVQMLVLAPNDRWAVLSGPRNLVKTITTGSHINQRPSWLEGAGQYILVVTILSAAFLEGATISDAIFLVLVLLLLHVVTWFRARNINKTPSIRGVSVVDVRQKLYGRRASLVNELSQGAMSDAWAYDSGLLTRRYIPEESKA